MWGSFERRLEAEHYLGRAVRAQALIDRLAGLPPDTAGETLRAELAALTYPDLRAFYNRVVELTGGPDGQTGGGSADDGRLQPRWERLLALRTVGAVVISKSDKASAEHFDTQDAEFVQACQPVDARFESVFIAAYSGKATDADADALAAAARDYATLGSRFQLSAAGQRQLSLRVARALDGLARACDAGLRHAEAMTHFSAAAARYAEAGEDHLAAKCIEHRDESGQRRAPDADTRLEQLLAELDTARPVSMERAAVLVELALLARGNNDDFEAASWANDAIAELAGLGYPVPGPDGADAAAEGWIEAMPPGDGDDPLYFQRRFGALVTLHTKLARVRLELARGGAGAWGSHGGGGDAPGALSVEEGERQLNRLGEITFEMTAHREAVAARLMARLGKPAEPGFGAAESTARASEFRAMMSAIDELSDLVTNYVPDGPETIARWRQMAADCAARARAFGQPLNLALALHAATQVELADWQVQAAMKLLEEEYRQVRDVPGKPAALQAITALTLMAKIQLGTLKDYQAALRSAVTAIELIERDRYRVSAPFQQAALLAPHADLFTTGIFAAWKGAAKGTPPARADYDLMLHLMELSKARASIRRLFLPSAADGSRFDRQLAELNDKIHALNPAAGAAGSAEDQRHQRDRASQAQQPLRRERLRLWDRRAVARGYPAAPVPRVTLKGLQTVLEPDEAVISYYWLNPLILLVVTITSDGIAIDRKLLQPGEESVPEESLRAKLERLSHVVGSLTGSNRALDSAFIAPLAPLLLPVDGLPLLDGKQRLIISPHRLLHCYPFAALPYQGEPLVRSFAIRYAPNLTSLLVPAADPAAPRTAALAVSDFPGRPELGQLSGAREAAAEIAAVYSAAGLHSSLMAEPTRSEVLAAMGDGTLAGAWCLHVDTHGHSLMDEVSRNAPLESVLELADNSVDGYEIAAADLGSEVVVLTACYAGQRAISGRGMAEQPGDELFGLAAAFLDARCRSVLAPAWPADHETIPQIITMFHRYLASGAPADIALAKAQRAFLDAADFETRPAYYWAPLVLTAVGRPRSLAASRNAPPYP